VASPEAPFTWAWPQGVRANRELSTDQSRAVLRCPCAVCGLFTLRGTPGSAVNKRSHPQPSSSTLPLPPPTSSYPNLKCSDVCGSDGHSQAAGSCPSVWAQGIWLKGPLQVLGTKDAAQGDTMHPIAAYTGTPPCREQPLDPKRVSGIRAFAGAGTCSALLCSVPSAPAPASLLLLLLLGTQATPGRGRRSLERLGPFLQPGAARATRRIGPPMLPVNRCGGGFSTDLRATWRR